MAVHANKTKLHDKYLDWHQFTKMYIITFIIISNYEKNHLIKILSSLIVKFSDVLMSKPRTNPI